jgi:hypothetical protein
MLLVADVLFPPPVVEIAPAVGAVILITLWGALPLRIRRMARESESGGAHGDRD